jgi:hypothetical protein
MIGNKQTSMTAKLGVNETRFYHLVTHEFLPDGNRIKVVKGAALQAKKPVQKYSRYELNMIDKPQSGRNTRLSEINQSKSYSNKSVSAHKTVTRIVSFHESNKNETFQIKSAESSSDEEDHAEVQEPTISYSVGASTRERLDAFGELPMYNYSIASTMIRSFIDEAVTNDDSFHLTSVPNSQTAAFSVVSPDDFIKPEPIHQKQHGIVRFKEYVPTPLETVWNAPIATKELEEVAQPKEAAHKKTKQHGDDVPETSKESSAEDLLKKDKGSTLILTQDQKPQDNRMREFNTSKSAGTNEKSS